MNQSCKTMFNKLFTHLSKSRPILASSHNSAIFISQFKSFSKCSINLKEINSSYNGEQEEFSIAHKVSKNLEQNKLDNRLSQNQTEDDKWAYFDDDPLSKESNELSSQHSQEINLQTNTQTFENSDLSFLNDLRNLESIDMNPNSKKMEREFIKTITPELPPTFSLATYANHLDIIRQLVKLNVRLCDIEKNTEATKFLIKLDFDKDVIPYLNFLIKCGLKRNQIGDFLTKNFAILLENIQNLEKRIAYLRKMDFTQEEIVSMLVQHPVLINYSIEHMDQQMGFIQAYLRIKPKYVRLMVLGFPKILSLKQLRTYLEERKFALIEQCGFKENQMKQILIHNSRILKRENEQIAGSFEYIFENITQDYQLITGFPGILCIGRKRLRERDLYLKKLGRAQYDPLKPLYVPLSVFIKDDLSFIKEICKTDEDDFYRFIKTM